MNHRHRIALKIDHRWGLCQGLCLAAQNIILLTNCGSKYYFDKLWHKILFCWQIVAHPCSLFLVRRLCSPLLKQCPILRGTFLLHQHDPDRHNSNLFATSSAKQNDSNVYLAHSFSQIDIGFSQIQFELKIWLQPPAVDEKVHWSTDPQKQVIEAHLKSRTLMTL